MSETHILTSFYYYTVLDITNLSSKTSKARNQRQALVKGLNQTELPGLSNLFLVCFLKDFFGRCFLHKHGLSAGSAVQETFISDYSYPGHLTLRAQLTWHLFIQLATEHQDSNGSEPTAL